MQNKSTVGINPNFSTANFKSCLFNIHSVLNSCCLDSLSASTLRTPGIWVAESQLFFKITQCHILCTTWFISKNWVLPILFIAATAEVLSSWSRIWECLTLSHNDLNPYSAVFNSNGWCPYPNCHVKRQIDVCGRVGFDYLRFNMAVWRFITFARNRKFLLWRLSSRKQS